MQWLIPICFGELQQFSDREQRHNPCHKRQHRHRRSQNQDKNYWNENDCGEYSFDEFQVGSAPPRARGTARGRTA